MVPMRSCMSGPVRVKLGGKGTSATRPVLAQGRSHQETLLPPATVIHVARTYSVPALVAQGHAWPESLRIPQCSRFRQEVLRSRACSVSRIVDRFPLLRHRDRARCDEQRDENEHRELMPLCSPFLASSELSAEQECRSSAQVPSAVCSGKNSPSSSGMECIGDPSGGKCGAFSRSAYYPIATG
jgi:hypothetical protein